MAKAATSRIQKSEVRRQMMGVTVTMERGGIRYISAESLRNVPAEFCL